MQSKTAFWLHFHSIVLLCAVAAPTAPTQAASAAVALKRSGAPPEASSRRVARHALVTRHNGAMVFTTK